MSNRAKWFSGTAATVVVLLLLTWWLFPHDRFKRAWGRALDRAEAKQPVERLQEFDLSDIRKLTARDGRVMHVLPDGSQVNPDGRILRVLYRTDADRQRVLRQSKPMTEAEQDAVRQQIAAKY